LFRATGIRTLIFLIAGKLDFQTLDPRAV